jgi:hypothetical protein
MRASPHTGDRESGRSLAAETLACRPAAALPRSPAPRVHLRRDRGCNTDPRTSNTRQDPTDIRIWPPSAENGWRHTRAPWSLSFHKWVVHASKDGHKTVHRSAPSPPGNGRFVPMLQTLPAFGTTETTDDCALWRRSNLRPKQRTGQFRALPTCLGAPAVREGSEARSANNA